MKSVVLALASLVFCSTVYANAPEEKPLPHYMATATANTFNRLKTFGNYTKWIANRVPKDQMKDFNAFLKEKGIKPTTKIPKFTAENEKACIDKVHCFVFTADTMSLNGNAFKVQEKPFRQVVEDICNKIGCDTKAAKMSFIQEAHALGQFEWTLLGALGGGLVGNLAAEPLGVDRTKSTVVGALLGGVAAYALSDENKAVCAGNCQVTCNQNNQYYIQPRQPVAQPYNYYGQPQPPYYVPPQVYHQTYSQQPPPCYSQDRQQYYRRGPTDLEIALNTPHRPTYCNTTCGQPVPYQPVQQQAYYQDPRYNAPADVRNVQSEGTPAPAPAAKEPKKK